MTVGDIRLSAVFFAMFLVGFGLHLVSIPLALLQFVSARLITAIQVLRQICYMLMAFGAFGGILFLGAEGMPAEFRILFGVPLFFLGVRASNGLRKQLADLRR